MSYESWNTSAQVLILPYTNVNFSSAYFLNFVNSHASSSQSQFCLLLPKISFSQNPLFFNGTFDLGCINLSHFQEISVRDYLSIHLLLFTYYYIRLSIFILLFYFLICFYFFSLLPKYIPTHSFSLYLSVSFVFIFYLFFLLWVVDDTDQTTTDACRFSKSGHKRL